MIDHPFAVLAPTYVAHRTRQVPPDNDCPKSWTDGCQTKPVYDYYCPECAPPACPSSSASGPPNGQFKCVVQDPQSSPYTLCAADTDKNESRFEMQLEDMRIRDAAIRHLATAKQAIDAGKFENFFIGAGRF